MKTFEYVDTAGNIHIAPLVQAMDVWGQPLNVVGDVDPLDCDHAGAMWSCQLDMRCPRCGAQMFLPPRHLARLARATIDLMACIWEEAGWPWYSNNGWLTDYAPEWIMQSHVLFEHVGGIPVRDDKLADWHSLVNQVHNGA